MNHIKSVQIGDSADKVTEEMAGLKLIDFIMLDNVVKELAALSILHNQKEMPASLNNLYAN